MKRWLGRLVLLVLLWLAGVLAWIWIGPSETEDSGADYALVLGAAVHDEVPSPVFRARIDHAVDLWQQGRVETLIFTGGFAEGGGLSEGEAARDYAIQEGVPESAIVVESGSQTTMENLVFAQPGMLDYPDGTYLIVSDPLHMRRAMQMADALGYDAQPSSTPSTQYRSLSTQLPFALRELYFIHHFWLFGE